MRVTKYRILVKVDVSDSETDSGIAYKENKLMGEVMQVGEGIDHVKVGDTVTYHDHSGMPVYIDGEMHMILGVRPDAGEVIAVV